MRWSEDGDDVVCNRFSETLVADTARTAVDGLSPHFQAV